ncbi:hypothetical protein PPERSA_10674 [Pseudocohnilembus persalinus]|uniref:HSF-type DNA-binding domain-containing protein n=1 Tax=Pseudocohnilembus persalinus TaxID=266149 RepID=A0A0V0QD89_PSEPJ|nr:hypothetical protein PPERSA_10674 [Pseudocohnilembus persalinus]|eukprot:KRX00175.1 hypothetical protein PPERSA_10674 [Pseudocohnilembus persalinus]
MIKPFISKEGLKELDNYKYVGGSYSWLDNKLNPYWTKLSELLPKTMAPNLVTFIGFIFILSSYATILPYDSTLKQNIPNWIFLKCGFDFFIYQTLDAMDGKQARRTKSSSPLGQLFDHGCDSFTLNFFLLVLVQAAKLDHFVLKIGFISTQILLFSANWIEYHTHVLNTQFMNFGVTESQLIAIFVCLTAGIFGQSTFQIKTISVIPSFLLNWLPVKNEMISYMLNKNVGDSLFIGLAGLTYLIFITNEEFKDIITWNDDGTSFKVLKLNEFSEKILPQFFKHNVFSSFVRQLNMYDFHKISKHHDTDENEWKHVNFKRGHPELLAQIKRKGSENQQYPKIIDETSQLQVVQNQEPIQNNEVAIYRKEEDSSQDQAVNKFLQNNSDLFKNLAILVNENKQENQSQFPRQNTDQKQSNFNYETQLDQFEYDNNNFQNQLSAFQNSNNNESEQNLFKSSNQNKNNHNNNDFSFLDQLKNNNDLSDMQLNLFQKDNLNNNKNQPLMITEKANSQMSDCALALKDRKQNDLLNNHNNTPFKDNSMIEDMHDYEMDTGNDHIIQTPFLLSKNPSIIQQNNDEDLPIKQNTLSHQLDFLGNLNNINKKNYDKQNSPNNNHDCQEQNENNGNEYPSKINYQNDSNNHNRNNNISNIHHHHHHHHNNNQHNNYEEQTQNGHSNEMEIKQNQQQQQQQQQQSQDHDDNINKFFLNDQQDDKESNFLNNSFY